MPYLGSWAIDNNLTFVANTHTPSTGAATDADSVPSYRVYEDETGTAILTGSMAKLDDANTTGFYSEQIALSAANGFEKGKCYSVYVSATVGAVVGTLSHTFQIEAEVDANRLNWANVDNPTTTVGLSGTTVKTATDVEADTVDLQARVPAALTGDGNIKADTLRVGGTLQTARDVGASVLLSSGTGAGQLDFTSGVVKANLAQILGTALTETAGQIAAAFKKFFDKATPTGTINSIPDAVAGAASGLALVGSNVGAATSVSGAVGSVTGNVGGNVTGSVGSVVGHTPQTGDNFPRLGVPAGASISADIAAIEAQTDDIGTAGAGLTAVPWNAAWDTEVQSEVQDAIELNHLDHLLAVDYDPASKPGVATALLNELIESDSGVSQFTANALEEAPSGGGGGGASVSDIFTANPADYDAANNFAQAVMWMRSMAAGKFVVNTGANTLTLYDLDGTTVLRTFDLTPSGGPYTTRVPQ